jgi:hypothetical protein
MTQKIVYQNTDGSVAIISIAAECPLPAFVIAQKDVPHGLPFIIVEEGNMPHDRTFRNAWVADFSKPHGHGGDFGAGTNFHPIDWVTPSHPIVVEMDEANQIVLGVHSWGEIEPDMTAGKGGNIEVDITKAREIKRNMIRAARTKALLALDVKYMQALERGDTVEMKALTTQKQALRDVPAHPDIEAAQTPDELMILNLFELTNA